MTIQARAGEHMGAVDRHALSLVDGGGIAVVEMVVVLERDCHARPAVEARRHCGLGYLFDQSQRPVLEAQAALVPEKHDPVAGGEVASAALGFDGYVRTQFALLLEP